MLNLRKNKTPDADFSPDAPTPVIVHSDTTTTERKPIPKNALIGAGVGAAALLGLAAYVLTRPAPEPDAPTITTRSVMPGGNSMNPGMPGGNSMGTTTVMTNSVTVPVTTMPGGNMASMPGGMPRPGGVTTTTTTVTGGAPGMPMGAASSAARMNTSSAATGASDPNAAPPMPVVAAANVRPGPGAPPTLAPSAMNTRPLMTPLTPVLAAQLQALWLEGAAAKHRGDYDAARAAWRKALQLRPGHPGLAEAIRKLPARR